MSKFVKNGSSFRVVSDANIDVRDNLPPGCYALKFDQMAGEFFLDEIDQFKNPSKIYGDHQKNADRILKTFERRPYGTGVLLSGDKGSGKSLLSKMVSAEGVQRGYPTIVMNEPWHGDKFNEFIQRIQQPAILFFDEFEKVYRDKEHQEAILTLLDGSYPSKKMFLFTANDKYGVNSHMRNRPGRIFYLIEFEGLEESFIREFCADNLHGTEYVDQICKLASLFQSFNFDILKALVEEMNAYGESPQDVMRILNAKPEADNQQEYLTVLIVDGKEKLSSGSFSGFPMHGANEEYYDQEKEGWNNYRFTPDTIQSVDAKTGTFRFEAWTREHPDDSSVDIRPIRPNDPCPEGFVRSSLTLTKKAPKLLDYWKAF